MLIVVLGNCALLVFYDYELIMDSHNNEELEANKTLKMHIIDYVNAGLTAIFALEAFFKIVQRGLILHPKAYLRTGWTLISVVIIISG